MSAPKPVTIRGARYPSVAAAVRALKVSATTIRAAMRDGALDEVARKNNVPVTIAGKTFVNSYDAAAQLGVSHAEVRAYCRVLAAAEVRA